MRLFNSVIHFILLVIGAVVAAMFATGGNTYLESDGNSVTVGPIVFDVASKQVVYISGWLGITSSSADSGEYVALDISPREYQFTIPSSLSVDPGDIVYIEVADTTAYVPDDTAYSKTSGAGKVAAFKATTAHYTGADGASRIVNGILIVK